MFAASQELNAMSDVFKNWELETMAKHCENSANRELVVSIYTQWEEKLKEAVMRDAEAAEFSEHSLGRVALKRWKTVLDAAKNWIFKLIMRLLISFSPNGGVVAINGCKSLSMSG